MPSPESSKSSAAVMQSRQHLYGDSILRLDSIAIEIFLIASIPIVGKAKGSEEYVTMGVWDKSNDSEI